MSKRKILLVDYDPSSIKQIKEVLIHQLDCEVEVALDGIAALNLFPQIKPDLVIIEAMLPKKHGFEVCLEIKKSPHGKNTPVLITTHVYKGRKYRDQAFHIYSCDEYIEKPISDQFLIDMVKRFLPDITESKKPDKKAKTPVEAKPQEEVKAATQKEKTENDEEKVALHEEKASIDSENLEKEISSKVDEILTLFSGTVEQKAPEPEEIEEVKVEEKPKKKAKKHKKKKKEVKPEPVLAAVSIGEKTAKELEESPAVQAGADSEAQLQETDTPPEENIATAEEQVPQEDVKVIQDEAEEKSEEVSESQESTETPQEEAQVSEKTIEQAIEEKLGPLGQEEIAPQEQRLHEESQVAQEEEQPDQMEEKIEEEPAIMEEATIEEEPVQEEDSKETEHEKAESADQTMDEADAQESSEEVPEEVVAVSARKRGFFTSKTIFIGLAAIIILGTIFILFPMLKGKSDDAATTQAGASISVPSIEDGIEVADDLERSISEMGPPAPDQLQDQLYASGDSALTEKPSQISRSMQTEAAVQKNMPSKIQKPKESIKKDLKQTARAKTPPAIDRNEKKTATLSSKIEEESHPPATKVKTPVIENNQKKSAPLSMKTAEEAVKKPKLEEAKVAPQAKTVPQAKAVPPPTEERKDLPPSTQKDSGETEKLSQVENKTNSSEKQNVIKETSEPSKVQKPIQPSATAKETSQKAQKQTSQPKEPSLPKEGQIIDYSLLDSEPSALAHDPPKYPFMARLKGLEGKVILRVLIMQTGYVGEVELIKGLEESVDEAAIEAASKWVYRPPTSQRIRVKTWKTETILFPPK